MRMQLDHPLFVQAMPIMKEIEANGYEAYFVGGCVRDTLLGKDIHDIDITTSALPDEIEAIFPLTFDVGKQFGTIVVVHKQENYEVTTFRVESDYSDSRHPDAIHFVRNLVEDTMRRDFTINALAVNSDGEVFDFHQGQEDLRQRIIRAVGTAHERFDEDALRMMRAIRFASQLDFRIEDATLAAIKQLAPKIKNVSIERLRIELSKLLQGKAVSTYFPVLVTSNLAIYLPHLQSLTDEVADRVTLQLRRYQEANVEYPETIAWFVLVQALQLSEKQTQKFLREWKHSNEFIQTVGHLFTLHALHQKGPLSKWDLYQYSEVVIRLFQQYCDLQEGEVPDWQEMYEALPIHHRQELALNGQDIIRLFELEKGGAIIGQVLSDLEYQVVVHNYPNNRVALEQYAFKMREGI